MKVLQTLGAHNKTKHVGIFQYRHFAGGIDLWPSYKLGNRLLNRILITHPQWEAMLQHIAQLNRNHYTLTDLKAEIMSSLKGVPGLHNNHGPAIAAILEHEGAVDHYGRGSAAISLKPEN